MTPYPSVVRSSPQFATTLAVYEMLHKHFPYPFAETTPAAALTFPQVGTRFSIQIEISHFGSPK